MSDMYEKISRPEERPRRRRGAMIFVLLAAALAALLLVAVLAWNYLSIRPQFYRFVSAVSESTTYAYEHECLRSEIDGASFRVSRDNTYSIYGALSVWTPGRVLHQPPEGEPALRLDYGDGGVLLAWQMVDGDGQTRAHGVCVQFDTPDGEHFLIEFEQASLRVLLRWAGGSWPGNVPWQG